jgi:hypothetical protein
MGWLYLTDNNPSNTINEFEEALYMFLNQCLINKDKLVNQLNTCNCYRFLIKTDIENDKIYCSNGRFFLKSRFLKNKMFKKNLIDYYKPLGIFVTGPKEILKRDGICTNRWLIELTMNSRYNKAYNI